MIIARLLPAIDATLGVEVWDVSSDIPTISVVPNCVKVFLIVRVLVDPELIVV